MFLISDMIMWVEGKSHVLAHCELQLHRLVGFISLPCISSTELYYIYVYFKWLLLKVMSFHCSVEHVF